MIAKRLKKGDTIGIVAPSKAFIEENRFELDNFVSYMTELGLKVKFSKNFSAKDKYVKIAGSPQQRSDDLNEMFSDPEINAIWCYQGGDAANQVLDLIDYELIKKNPKIILGKSDVDIILLALNKKIGLITFHGPDPKIGRNKEMDFEYNKKWFQKRIMNASKEIEANEHITIRDGKAQGKLLGCNLTILGKLAGTEYFPDFTDSILFLETYKSDIPTVVWKLTHLKMLGVFDKIKGIVVGNNFEFQGEFKVEEIVKDLTEGLPILKVNEFGHYQPHAFLPIGAIVKMDATNKTLEIVEDFLE